MRERNEILQRPLRWLLKALGSGVLLSAPVAFGIYGASLPRILVFVTIASIFSLVMWAGGALIGPWIFKAQPHLSPVGYAFRAHGLWLLAYVGLLAVSVFLIRILLGLNLARNLQDLAFTAMIGYLISSVILGFKLTETVARTSRELEAAHARATLLALRAQLSPHTLFNGLNTVAALIPVDPAQAEAVVEGLSRLLRRILNALEREVWTLQEEFDLLKDLLELEQARFGERLQVTLTLGPEDQDRPVPPLLLLPLVENSLKHGFRPKIGTCRLSVTVDGPRITVTDDGVGRTPEAPEGVGLRTVRQRLEAHGGTLRWREVPTGAQVEVMW